MKNKITNWYPCDCERGLPCLMSQEAYEKAANRSEDGDVVRCKKHIGCRFAWVGSLDNMTLAEAREALRRQRPWLA